MIVIRDLAFSYTGQSPVLCAASAELDPGLTLVVGPNGCGKSTLIKLIAGVERPASGVITVDGFDLWRDEVAARRQLALVPEKPDLSPFATVEEILVLVGELRCEPRAAVEAAVAWAGLDTLRRRTVRELSKGERRRATLAAARIGRPRWLILDEPYDGLDRDLRDTISAWIDDHLAGGGGAVVVSHDLEPVLPRARTLLTLERGRLVTVSLPAAAETRRALVERAARGGGHQIPRG